jgi:hypothetical protein
MALIKHKAELSQTGAKSKPFARRQRLKIASLEKALKINPAHVFR